MSAGEDWVEQARRLVETFRAGTSAGTPSGPGGELTGDCRWCPLCQAAAVLRGERPEVSAALADVLTATATALRGFAGEPAPPADGPPAEERPAHPVQKIDLS